MLARKISRRESALFAERGRRGALELGFELGDPGLSRLQLGFNRREPHLTETGEVDRCRCERLSGGSAEDRFPAAQGLAGGLQDLDVDELAGSAQSGEVHHLVVA